MARKIVGYLNLFSSPNLGALSETRTPASCSFLGRFALMDFALSNFTNSGIDAINVLIKNNFRSVSKHIGTLKTWVNNTKINRQNLLLNEKGIKNPKDNTELNCILQNDWVLLEAKPDYVVIQPAHIVTTVDLKKVVKYHEKNEADITVAYKEIDDADETFIDSRVLKIKDGVVSSFKKNSKKNKKANISLGVYVISYPFLLQIIHNPEYLALGSLDKVIDKAISRKIAKVLPYEYQGYARCFDSFIHFVNYSFELFDADVAASLFKDDWICYTHTHNTPPSRYGVHANVQNAFIANGVYINGKVENSVISRNVQVNKGAVVKNSIILADTYIDEGAVIENAVVDKYCHITKKVKIQGKGNQFVYLEQGTLAK